MWRREKETSDISGHTYTIDQQSSCLILFSSSLHQISSSVDREKETMLNKRKRNETKGKKNSKLFTNRTETKTKEQIDVQRSVS